MLADLTITLNRDWRNWIVAWAEALAPRAREPVPSPIASPGGLAAQGWNYLQRGSQPPFEILTNVPPIAHRGT